MVGIACKRDIYKWAPFATMNTNKALKMVLITATIVLRLMLHAEFWVLSYWLIRTAMTANSKIAATTAADSAVQSSSASRKKKDDQKRKDEPAKEGTALLSRPGAIVTRTLQISR